MRLPGLLLLTFQAFSILQTHDNSPDFQIILFKLLFVSNIICVRIVSKIQFTFLEKTEFIALHFFSFISALALAIFISIHLFLLTLLPLFQYLTYTPWWRTGTYFR